jgi:hypothetical protein
LATGRSGEISARTQVYIWPSTKETSMVSIGEPSSANTRRRPTGIEARTMCCPSAVDPAGVCERSSVHRPGPGARQTGPRSVRAVRAADAPFGAVRAGSVTVMRFPLVVLADGRRRTGFGGHAGPDHRSLGGNPQRRDQRPA